MLLQLVRNSSDAFLRLRIEAKPAKSEQVHPPVYTHSLSKQDPHHVSEFPRTPPVIDADICPMRYLWHGANPLKDSSHMFLNGGSKNQPWDAAIEAWPRDRWKPTVHLRYINISRSTEFQWWRCWLCPDSLSVQRMGLFFISILLLQKQTLLLFIIFMLLRKKNSKVVVFFLDLLSIKKLPVWKVTCSGNLTRAKHKGLGSESVHHINLPSSGKIELSGYFK